MISIISYVGNYNYLLTKTVCVCLCVRACATVCVCVCLLNFNYENLVSFVVSFNRKFVINSFTTGLVSAKIY